MNNSTDVILGLFTVGFADKIAGILTEKNVPFKLKDTNIEAFKSDNKNPSESGAKLTYLTVDASDATRAVSVVETYALSAATAIDMKLSGLDSVVLIPVDLTESSLMACRLGFDLAHRLQLTPILIHSYAIPFPAAATTDSTFPSLSDGGDPVEEAEMEERIEQVAQNSINVFKAKLDAEIKAGRICNLKYSVIVEPGVPEEVILNYTRQTPPGLVVMATRDNQKKSKELIGSVTAEVLDSCRVPVFTVPERDCSVAIEDITRLAFFCNLDNHDPVGVEFLMKMFQYPKVDILLLPAVKVSADTEQKIKELTLYLSSLYPQASFTTATLKERDVRLEIERLISDFAIQMLIVPNKKQNIFARIFNPGIPHKILFERDIPMLALPV